MKLLINENRRMPQRPQGAAGIDLLSESTGSIPRHMKSNESHVVWMANKKIAQRKPKQYPKQQKQKKRDLARSTWSTNKVDRFVLKSIDISRYGMMSTIPCSLNVL